MPGEMACSCSPRHRAAGFSMLVGATQPGRSTPTSDATARGTVIGVMKRFYGYIRGRPLRVVAPGFSEPVMFRRDAQ